MVDVPQELIDVSELIAKHSRWREGCLNLIASENSLSPRVRAALDNDWLGRYADYTGRDRGDRRYRGTRYIQAVEALVERLARELWPARYYEFRPIAGHLAGIAVLMALCEPGDTVLEASRSSGGHREAAKFAAPGLIDLDVQFLPFDGAGYNIDLPASLRQIDELAPRAVILGTSNFLFPHPVREIKAALKARREDAILVYDASHVLGLLAGGQFQDPLGEGADVVFSSTHKTFPGPQGGIVFTDRKDLIEPISQAVYPALVTNHHPFRMPALAVAMAEMRAFGRQYAVQILANAQALGAALEAEGVSCVCVNGRYSGSHTVLMRVAGFGTKEEVALELEAADIICTALELPEAQGGEGIRLGVQEMTHHGAGESDMAPVARLIADVLLRRRQGSRIREEVHALVSRMGPVRYTWEC